MHKVCWVLACFSSDRKTGNISIIKHDETTSIKEIPLDPATDTEKPYKPVFLGISRNEKIILMDPVSKKIHLADRFPTDAFPAHAYPDPYSERVWYMNDGDKQTGNDTLNCGTQGSSVMVVSLDKANQSKAAKVLKTICVGRGHHNATFTAPSENAPNVPRRTFISNLKDGTLSVIGNDPDDEETWLKLVATINLCQAEKEENGQTSIPNNSFPHGTDYSPLTGKLYCLSNGYEQIQIIDPIKNIIESTIELKGSRNLLLHPAGQFLIGKGADRKSDPNHVIGELPIIDVVQGSVAGTVKIPDVYAAKYTFSEAGDKLYLACAASGNDEQQKNAKTDIIQVYDTSALPNMPLLTEIKVGQAQCGSRSADILTQQDGSTPYVFVTNPTDGSVSVIDAASDTVIETVALKNTSSHARLYDI